MNLDDLPRLPIRRARREDEVIRSLRCGHGTTSRVESSLSRVWCSTCEDMVRAEFYAVPERVEV